MQSLVVEEEDVFFDSIDKTPTDISSCSSVDEEQELEFNLDSDFWKKELISVQERRKRFLLGMGLNEFVSSPLGFSPETREFDQFVENVELQRIAESSGAKLDSLSTRDDGEQKDALFSIRDLDSGRKFIIHDLEQDGVLSMLKEVGSDKLISFQEFEALLGLSSSVQKLLRKEATPSGEKTLDGGLSGRIKKTKSWWAKFIPRRSLSGTCKNDASLIKDSKLPRTIRAKVLRHEKNCLEFTALYTGQEIRVHKGLIRAMKFSPSGRYLASGGEDCVVRIWQVREVDSSCKCSAASSSCDIVDKVKDRKSMGRKCIGFAPIVIPKKVFMIDETPLQELHGHTGEILDLSWSSSDCLLTSSMDRTVRLWKVSDGGCIGVFQHSDYVTCVQFNPIDNEYFISGSIDGKVRIWSVSEKHVVDWADIRDIVTAVCYRPEGEGFIVGSVTGNCRFYNYTGNRLHMETQFCAHGRKKSAGKPITSLQFSPEDPHRLMITSTDSRIRIFDGADVIHKYRGLRKTKTQLSASFTTDGRYIISVGEDSKVYLWNYDLSNSQSCRGAKPTKSVRSCELFSSDGVSVAVAWPGTGRRDSALSSSSSRLHLPSQAIKILEPSTWLWGTDFCSLGAWLFADGMSKGTATWPEENLLASPRHQSEVDGSHKQHRRHMHHGCHRLTHLSATWSLVIVTASCDGIIRSFHNYGLPVRL